MKRKLALVTIIAIILSSLLINQVYCDEVIVDEVVTFEGDYPIWPKYWCVSLDGGSNVSIDISLQTGDSLDFTIVSIIGKGMYRSYDFQSLQTQWTAPYTDTFHFTIWSHQFSAARVTIRIVGGQVARWFDMLQVGSTLAVIVVVAFIALMIIRRWKKLILPPPIYRPRRHPFISCSYVY